jgi:hypothetical protein
VKKGGTFRDKQREHARRSALRRNAREKVERKVQPSDLAALRRGNVKPCFRNQLAAARRENRELYDAIGGEAAGPMRIALAQNAASLGVIARALIVRLAQSADWYLSTKIASVLSARRAALVAIGLGLGHRGELEERLTTPDKIAEEMTGFPLAAVQRTLTGCSQPNGGDDGAGCAAT